MMKHGGGVRRPRHVLAVVVSLALAALRCHHADPKPVVEPAGRVFLCGQTTCDAGASYCELLKTDYAPLPDTYTCRPLPETCRAKGPPSADCGCFPRGTRCDFCSKLEQGGVSYLQRTCVGGY
jgi:hypothetical protein